MRCSYCRSEIGNLKKSEKRRHERGECKEQKKEAQLPPGGTQQQNEWALFGLLNGILVPRDQEPLKRGKKGGRG